MTRRSLLLVAFIGLGSIFAIAGSNYDSGIARMSYLEGRVSFQHAGDIDWNAASVNMALQPADRIYTGEEGRAEIQFDEGSVLRLAEKTDIEILALKEDFIQIRVLAGLATLNVNNKVHFEINTAAAAFNTTRQGVYRFLVEENGDTDGIVRKGLLDVANNSVSKRLNDGDLIHIAAGDRSTFTLSRYLKRDEWDEWNDRRNADMVAYESRKYLPSNVYTGVRELDRHGRWIVVNDYGPAWVPLYVDSGWSPYWNGRWHHRPSWGWTWTSYEPWGWLPYHYGRWSFNLGVGWHWLPGPSYGFHFWSPGLVRFYRGANWVSWCPLGPGDYYDTNRYFYRRGHGYYLNALRLNQRRGPEDLFNRNIPGAFRTARTEQFANESLRGGRSIPVPGAEQPWRGRMVTGQLGIEPTARSFAPAPDRPALRPAATNNRPAIVRTEPAFSSATPQRYSRITTPGIEPVPALVPQQERGTLDGTRTFIMDSRGTGSSLTRSLQPSTADPAANRPSTWSRQPTDTFDSGARPSSRGTGSMISGDRNDEGYRVCARDFTGGQGTRPGYTPPNRLEVPPISPGNRYERSVPESQPRGERPRSEFRPRPEPSDASPTYIPRAAPRYEPRYSPSRSSGPSWGGAGERSYGRGTPAPSMGGGRDFGGGSPSRSIPQVRQAPQGGRSSPAPSMQRRRDN